jgi:hypothetical protein
MVQNVERSPREEQSVDVASDQAQLNADYLQSRARRQQWGKTAVGFIFSGAATGIFALLSYVLWPVNRVPAIPCCALAVFFFLVFAYNSYSIIRWWIVLAKKSNAG